MKPNKVGISHIYIYTPLIMKPNKLGVSLQKKLVLVCFWGP